MTTRTLQDIPPDPVKTTPPRDWRTEPGSDLARGAVGDLPSLLPTPGPAAPAPMVARPGWSGQGYQVRGTFPAAPLLLATGSARSRRCLPWATGSALQGDRAWGVSPWWPSAHGVRRRTPGCVAWVPFRRLARWVCRTPLAGWPRVDRHSGERRGILPDAVHEGGFFVVLAPLVAAVVGAGHQVPWAPGPARLLEGGLRWKERPAEEIPT